MYYIYSTLLCYYTITILYCYVSFFYSLFFVICYLLSSSFIIYHLLFIVYCLLFILCSLFYLLSFIFYLYLFIYIREDEKKRKIKNKRGEKKVSKKGETEKFSKIAYFLAFFSVSVFFGNAIYSLLFHRSMRVIFALKIAAFLALFFSTFCRFFVGVTPLRSLLFGVAAVFCLYLPPPYIGRAEISLTLKKIFFYFF